MKTEDTEVPGRWRAKPGKIKIISSLTGSTNYLANIAEGSRRCITLCCLFSQFWGYLTVVLQAQQRQTCN